MLCWLNEKEMSVQELLQRVQCVIAHVDEIMQRDIRPLLAEDIIEQLHRQFALLSGGRGQDGAPIITFPEFSGFGEVPEEDFLNVVTYLTSIPSLDAASIGFIVIMDRRKDKWSSVKMSLSRIAGAFPGNLQLVFVLRPNRFFQRTIADIGIKLHKDDFKMKIVMINSLSELHGYVDKGQLTNELGGSLEYCHSQWIHHRTAVENFAMTVKTTAQHLKGFGTDVADTELPNNVQNTKDLLVAHTEKHTYLKNELTLAVKQGTTLLGCIKEQPAKTESHKMNPDEIENQTTVERLMAQLDETDNAFEQFWCKHHLKLEQCLQLRHFEQDFREIKLALDGLMDSLSRLSDIGNCVSKVESNLEQLNSLTEKAQPTVEKAQLHASHGDQLIQSNHYAVDSIRPKCVELRRVCDDFSNEAQRKTEVMSKTLQIHRGINKITNWCEDGIYLLASQAVDKCQSQDGAESALTETQQFLKTAEDCQLIELKDLNTQYELVLPEDLKTSVLKTLKRLDDVQEMFEKRCVSLKRLSAKQTRPVQSVAPRPESPPKRPPVKNTRTPPSAQQPLIRRAIDNSNSNKQQTEVDSNKKKSQRKAAKGNIKIEVMHEVSQGGSSHVVVSNETEENLSNRRTHIMTELIETERIYVEELQSIMEGYFAELDNSEISYLIPPSLENKRDVLFGNLPEIYEFHNRTFLGELESCADMPELVGSCFQKRKEELQVYQKYCQNKPRSEVLWRECGDSPFFQECQKKLDHKLSLDAYLLKPVQRITKYQLMLKEMLKCTKSEGKAELEEALATMLDIVKSVNDAMHQISITGFEGNLSDLGKLLMQGSFNMWTEHKKGHNKVKDLARFKPMQRHLFLYDKMLLFCKKREETEGHEKNPSYSFKHSLKMSAVGITETVKGDSKKFEVWYNGREEVYIIQAPSMDTKNTWVSEIRKVLTGQLEACREASQLHQKITDISGVPMRHMRKMALRQSDSSSPESTIRMSNLSQNMRHKRADTSGSHSSHTADTARKRFTLQGLSKRRSLPAEPATKEAEPPRRFSLTSSLSSSNSSFVARRRKGPLNVSTQNKRHQIKSDPTPLGYEDTLSDALTSVEKQLKLTSSTSGRGMSVMLRSSSQPGWAQRRLASMDTEDFETIPSSIEESSDSSEEGNCNKDVDAGCFQVELIPESPETQDVPLESSNSIPVQDDAGTRL